MLLILTTVTFLLLGRELSARLWRTSVDPLSGAERLVSSISIAFALWLASLWAAALLGELNATFLAARNVLAAACAAALWFLRWRESRPRLVTGRPAVVALISGAALVVWIAFILWRGLVIPPVSHDALAYHLPKAVLYARAEAYDPLPELPARARNIPVNYELMLAEVLIIEGDDTVSEWLSALHYLYFIAAGVALARRWWGSGTVARWTVALLTAGVPVALLHSGAHKNDLMTAGLMTASLVWLGRFFSSGELRALVLAASTLMMAAGTKPQAAVLALAALPFAIATLARRPRFARRLATIAAVSVLFIVLLGGAYWFIDRGARGPDNAPQAAAVPVSYGDWVNIWQVPYVLLRAPFSTSSTALPVPWSENAWFWRRYEIYFSELGIPFAICALLLPVAALRYRNSAIEKRSERAIVSAIAAITFVAMLPVVFRPLGFYAISAPRYVLFIVPVVFGWTAAPFLRHATSLRAHLVFATALGAFVAYGAMNAWRDAFAPLDYVQWASAQPGTRVVPFEPNRAPSVVDRAAAADAAVAIETAEGAWLYPVFGSRLTRPVQLIPAGTAAPVRPEVGWVVIDRTFAAVWRHPSFQNLSQTREFIARGSGDLQENPLFRALSEDARWERFYVAESSGQAIFRRVTGSARMTP